MIRMIEVFDAIAPETGYLAEVPGHPGCHVPAESVVELRIKLRAAMARGEGLRFTTSASGATTGGRSGTALFVRV
jgi:hypothetical protein